tara:strand:+ start:10414 stop:10827 length:414 start_codon:yes stop_codon:yes gene_type:complete
MLSVNTARKRYTVEKKTLLLVMALVALAGPVRADELTAATTALCEKVKSCAMAQMSQANLTPEMSQMMQPMIDNMCADMQGKVAVVAEGHALYEPAVACMRSLEKTSCAEMQSSSKAPTAECAAYEEKARKFDTADN